MSDVFNHYKSFFLVGIGAAPGAILRMQLSIKCAQYKKFNLSGIQIVNTIATFLLGVVLAIRGKLIIDSTTQQLYLLICVGFLGSFSSFSSLVYELYLYFVDNKYSELFISILCSIGLGMIAALIGYSLGSG